MKDLFFQPHEKGLAQGDLGWETFVVSLETANYIEEVIFGHGQCPEVQNHSNFGTYTEEGKRIAREWDNEEAGTPCAPCDFIEIAGDQVKITLGSCGAFLKAHRMSRCGLLYLPSLGVLTERESRDPSVYVMAYHVAMHAGILCARGHVPSWWGYDVKLIDGITVDWAGYTESETWVKIPIVYPEEDSRYSIFILRSNGLVVQARDEDEANVVKNNSGY